MSKEAEKYFIDLLSTTVVTTLNGNIEFKYKYSGNVIMQYNKNSASMLVDSKLIWSNFKEYNDQEYILDVVIKKMLLEHLHLKIYSINHIHTITIETIIPNLNTDLVRLYTYGNN
jgi:hypothetical protein